nr:MULTISPECIES: putative holin [Providencia]
MPSTAAGAIVGAAGGGAIGLMTGSFDYGVITGAIIGATVAVIASKDNNKKKVLLFILSFLTGVLISESVERIIVAETGYEIGKTLTAILVSALFISLLLIIASSETLTKAIRWLPRLIENNFSVLMSTLTEKWRGKKWVIRRLSTIRM